MLMYYELDIFKNQNKVDISDKLKKSLVPWGISHFDVKGRFISTNGPVTSLYYSTFDMLIITRNKVNIYRRYGRHYR